MCLYLSSHVCSVRRILIRQPIRIIGLFFAGLLLTWITQSSASESTSVSLAWTAPSPNDSTVGYNVYYGTESRTYTETINVGNVTTCTVAALPPDTTHFFAVTTYDTFGIESILSEELIVDREPPGILGLEDVVVTRTEALAIRLPDLTANLTVSDDVSPAPQIQLAQHPFPGKVVGQGDTTVTVQATDAAGNTRTLSTTYRVTLPSGEIPPTDDSDADGVLDTDEFIAGSDPREEQSFFSVAVIHTNGTAAIVISGVELAATGGEARVAILERCTDLAGGRWETLRAEPVPGPGTDPMPITPDKDFGATFYRVRMVLE